MKIYIDEDGLKFLHELAVALWDETFNQEIDGQKWRLN